MAQSVFAPPLAEPVVRGSGGTIFAVSSFGVDGTTFGPGFQPKDHFEGERYRTLDFKHQFPLCKRHDDKIYDFQGRVRKAGSGYALTQPLIGSSMPSTYVPMDQRRPSHPYRLARLIVRSFTALVFGEGRFPKITSDDPETADFCEAIVKAAELQARFAQARNVGGGMGSVLVAWGIHEGAIRVSVHGGKNVVPHTWIDREGLELEHASKLTQTVRVEWDAKAKKNVPRYYIQRRDWTPTADVYFEEVRADDPDAEWIVDEERTTFHGDGVPHCVWIRNGSEDDDDEAGVDGECDFEGQFEDLDGIDLLASVLSKGTVRNLDPTLVLSMDEIHERKAQGGVAKGSDGGLSVGQGGEAKYLELAGSSATTGLALLDSERGRILEVAQCVIPSSDEMSAAGMSAVAQKLLYAPSIAQCNAHRTAYGGGIVRLLGQILESVRRRGPDNDPETGEPVYPIAVNDTGDEEETRFVLDLPPRVVEDPDGGESTKVERVPGHGRIWLEWPDYFEKTPADLEAKARSVTAAAGGKPALSQRTAVEIMAREVGVDPASEWERVRTEAKDAAELEQGIVGGGLTGPLGADPHAEVKAKTAAAVAPQIQTVNELRAAQGLGPLALPGGALDERGDLPLPAFLALLDAAGQAAGAGAPGKALGGDPNPEPSTPASPGEEPGKGPPAPNDAPLVGTPP